MIELGAMNFSLPGLRTDMATSMAPSVQATQVIPFPGKLGLSGRVASQATAIEVSESAEIWWAVRTQVALAFYELYGLDQTLEVMTETLGLLQNFETVARSLYAAGTGRQADLLRASVAVARMRAELARLEIGRIAAAARLNAVLDRPAETPIPSPTLAPLPLELPGTDTLQSWAEASRPLLEGMRLRVEQADTRHALARKEIWPDFMVGVQYGQNRGLMGTERMGSAMIGFSLPIFAGRRQLKAREEAAALESAAQAELSAERAVVGSRILELVAGLEQTRALIALYRREALPQAAANVASALAAYRAGTVDFLTLIDAQLGHNGYQRELHALVAEYGATVAELEMTLGRELPATGEILAEVP
jgi:outer membrane protein TolC